METKKDLYSSAHLVVSAVRVFEHQQKVPPSIEEICTLLSFNPEQGHMICRKLGEMGVLEIVEGAFGTRLYIQDHLKIEEIPKGKKDSELAKELAAFQDSRKGISKKIESFQAQQAEKKKSLFADLEKQLKDKLEKKK
jgi:hypothetical protein